MIWLLVALLSSAVAGVGFWRGTAVGLADETMPALAGVLFSLLMFRATTLVKDRAALGKQGGWPLRVAGALSLTAALGAAVDVGFWYQTRKASFGQLALPTAVIAFALIMITALRLSANSPRRTHFYGLALAAAANAGVSAWFFVHTQLPGISR
jgi:undecaprenyl pyrophosphate phosphatase UppP